MVDDTQICHLSSNSTFETQAINFVSITEGLHKPQNNATFSRDQYMAPYVWADEVRSLTDISIRAPLSRPDLGSTHRPEDRPSGPKMAAASSWHLTFYNTGVKNMTSMHGIKLTDVLNFYHLNR
jgi:hypothetical protein